MKLIIGLKFYVFNLFSSVLSAGTGKQNQITPKKWRWKKFETLSSIKLTHSLPASVEDAIELKLEERRVSVPWCWRGNCFLYGNLGIELVDKSLRYKEVWWTAKRPTSECWMFVGKIKVLRLSLSVSETIMRDKGCYLHAHRHLHMPCRWRVFLWLLRTLSFCSY